MPEPIQDEKPIQEHHATFSKPAAYGIVAGAAVGTAALAITAPQTFAAGMGSVSTSSAVFITPVWRFIKRVNDLYTDTALYLKADWEHLRGRHFGPPSHKERDVLAAHTPRFSRAGAYSVFGATLATTGFLGVYAPSVLAAAFGSIVVSGASFTKPVVDLVHKVNELYLDTYHYVKGDLDKTKKLKVKPPVNDVQEIDRSISAPVTEQHKFSKPATYALLAAATVAGVIVAATTPSLLVAAAGTILGSAISYTAPALKWVKKINRVYDKTEDQIIDDIADLKDGEELKPAPAPKKPETVQEAFHISRPMAYLIAAGTIATGAGILFYAPALATAAIGGILGAASSFTEPVLKQVGKVNAFYIDACKYMKDDWLRIRGPKPQLLQKPSGNIGETLAETLKQDMPKTETPKVETAAEFNKVAAPQQPEPVRVEFNTTAPRPEVNDNKKQPDLAAQPTASVRQNKPDIPKL